MANETIQWVSDKKRFEFTEQEDGMDEFVHHSDIDLLDLKSVEGHKVKTGKIKTGEKGTTSLKEIREDLLISKAELARKAGLSPMTIERVENGMSCRMNTKRKIILALGRDLSESSKIFPND